VIEPTSTSDQLELFGLSVLELREFESKVGSDAIRPLKSTASSAHREPGIVAAVLDLTPFVVQALLTILIVPRAGRRREVRMVKRLKSGGCTEVVIKESDYKTGTLSPAIVKALADLFSMDISDAVKKISGNKE